MSSVKTSRTPSASVMKWPAPPDYPSRAAISYRTTTTTLYVLNPEFSRSRSKLIKKINLFKKIVDQILTHNQNLFKKIVHQILASKTSL